MSEIFIEKEAILEVINKLFISTDNKDWIKVQECFSNEVIFDMTSMTGGEPVKMTPQQITDGWEKGLKDLKAVHHQVGNNIVKITGKSAKVFCYGIAYHYLPNKSGENTRTFVGSYNFGLLKKKGKWLINKFKFNLKFIDGNLELEKSK